LREKGKPKAGQKKKAGPIADAGENVKGSSLVKSRAGESHLFASMEED